MTDDYLMNVPDIIISAAVCAHDSDQLTRAQVLTWHILTNKSQAPSSPSRTLCASFSNDKLHSAAVACSISL